MRNILITICARGGSKGIPNKNLLLINEKPLVVITINHAKELAQRIKTSKINVLIGLSSDYDKILNEGNGSVDFLRSRPQKLASDQSGKIEAINDLIQYCEAESNLIFDTVIDLDVTAPEREVEDIISALNLLDSDKSLDLIMSVNHATKNPYFNMVEKGPENTYKICKDSDGYLRRQDAPNVYELSAAFYIYRKKFFEMGYRKVTDANFSIKVQKTKCIDIDSIEDYLYVKFKLEKRYEV